MKNLTVLITCIITFTFFGCNDNIELEKGKLISPGLYSLNTGTSFYWCNPDNLDACIAASEKFMPSIIRFPGGLDANFYHMDGKGYGYRRPPEGDSDEPDPRRGSNDDETKRSGSTDELSKGSNESKTGSSDDDPSKSGDEDEDCIVMRDSYHMGNKKYPKFQDRRDKEYPKDENVIENVIQFCKKTNTKILFTCNIVDATYEENKKVLDRLISEGITISGVEIGSEMYLPRFKCIKYESVQKYIDTAKWYSIKLKSDFSGIKLAVIAAPPLVKAIPKAVLSYYKAWNEALKKETFFDAYTVHHYAKEKSCNCEKDFSDTKTRDEAFECYNVLLQKELDYWFQEGIQYYVDMFPEKKMWLTEWNSHLSMHCYGNTQADNIYFARYQNELASKHSDNIEFATFHNWLGNGKHWPIIRPTKNGFEQRSSSPVFEMFKPIFSDRETFSVTNPGVLTNALLDGVTSYIYYQPSANSQKSKLIIMLVNFSGEKQKIQFPTNSLLIDGVSFDSKKGDFTSVYSESLAASLGNAGFGKKVEPIQVKNGLLLSPYVIEKNSINMISIEAMQ